MGIGRSAELVRKVQAAQFVAKHGDQVCVSCGNQVEHVKQV